MSKLFVTLPTLALIVALSGSAVADNGISQSTLQEMGLAGIELMSDADAMTIRGMGFDIGDHIGDHFPEPTMSEKPWSLAFGVSYANVDRSNDTNGSAGTTDGFIAEGKYRASGEHFSEAAIVRVEMHELQVQGQPATLVTIETNSLRVFAGGFATASSL